MAKTITEIGTDRKNKAYWLDKLASLLPDVLGGSVVKAKKKRKKKLEEM